MYRAAAREGKKRKDWERWTGYRYALVGPRLATQCSSLLSSSTSHGKSRESACAAADWPAASTARRGRAQAETRSERLPPSFSSSRECGTPRSSSEMPGEERCDR